MKRLAFYLTITFSIAFYSCEKESSQSPKASSEKGTENTTELIESGDSIYDPTFKSNASVQVKKFIESNTTISHDEFKSVIKSLDFNIDKTATPTVWGIGLNKSVWKWSYSGNNWYQPNSAARLNYVSVPKLGGSVWGIGTNHTVWKWNASGNHWYEPNSAARVYYIAAYDSQSAVGIGYNGQLVVTHDGGQQWYNYRPDLNSFLRISVGDQYSNPMWAINTSGGAPRLWTVDLSTGWSVIPTSMNIGNVAAMQNDGTYFAEYNPSNPKRVYKSYDGTNFFQPNPAARVYSSLTSAGNDYIWAIGSNNTPVRSTDGGYSWDTPNPAARLLNVNIGYEVN